MGLTHRELVLNATPGVTEGINEGLLGRWVELLVGSNMETLFGGLLIGLVIVAAIVATLLYSGARPTRGRLAKLCVLTAALGPLAGATWVC